MLRRPPPSLPSPGTGGYFQLDATSDQDWADAAARVGSLDVLVSNAGIAMGGKIEKVSMETWQRALDINILGAVRAARSLVPLMNEGGRIAITASLAGLVHSPSMATYNTAHLTSEVVARRSVKALERRRTVIVPDGFALVNWYVKRFARPVHLRALRAMGGKLSR